MLDQYDTLVWKAASEDNLDVANAASLLMRLEMLGVDVGRRWEAVAEVSAGRVGFHNRPFNDAHMMLAMVRGSRRNSAARMLEEMRHYAGTATTTVAPIMREIGVPLCEAITAYAEGAYGRAADLMMPIRYRWHVLGGSWAQRDVFQRMLIEAAFAAGRVPLARALLAERIAVMPHSVPSWQRYAAVLDADGAPDAASAARREAERLAA